MNVNRELLAFLRKQYPVGTRIRLDSMQDPYAPVEAGTTGKLDYIDDAGQFHMKWDNGRVLALIPGVDSFTVLPPELSMTKLYMPLMPDTPGLAVWKAGHIGIYIGNGEVVEAMGTKYGVVKTQLEGRGWTHWLEVPGIEYE